MRTHRRPRAGTGVVKVKPAGWRKETAGRPVTATPMGGWNVPSPSYQLPRPGRRGRIAPDGPPEAHRPFLDALAALLAAEVVAKITVGSGTQTHRKPKQADTI